MLKKILTSSLIGCLASVAMAQYGGRILIDSNGNGTADPADKTIAGVSVSDGLNVVKTDSDGRFELPGHDRVKFIYITTPSGYYALGNHYLAVKQEQEKNGYDFLLTPILGVAKDGSHKFLHISDTEINSIENQQEWIDDMRGYIESEKAAFLIHTGDICYEPGLRSHIKIMNTENMGCPVYYTIGNHDLVKGRYGEELFEEIYGPVYFSFEAGNVHYVVFPMPGGDHRPQYTKHDVYRWLKNDLALVSKDKSIVAFCHDVLTTGDRFIYEIDKDNSIDLGEHNLKAWLFGHWHTNYIKKQGDVLAVSTSAVDKGGIDHSVSAYRVMHVSGNGDLRSDLRYSFVNKALKIVSVHNGEIAVNDNNEINISVNAYDSPNDVKSMEWNIMIQNKIIKSGTLSQRTNWNWGTLIPFTKDLQGKSMVLNVVAKLGDGGLLSASEAVIAKVNNVVRTGSDWLTLLGNSEHIGIAKDTISESLGLAWTTNVGGNILMSSPLVVEGKVFVATVDEDLQGTAYVTALDTKSGKIAWKYKVRNSVKNSIAIDGKTLFAQDAQGYLYAIDIPSGELRWEKKLNVNGLPPVIEGLTADKGIVYAGTGSGLSAFQVLDGAQMWENSHWRQAEGATTTITVTDHSIISGAQWRGLYANDKTDGKLRWLASSDGLSDRGASPAIHGGLAYVISRNSLFILDAASGKVAVRKELPYKVDVTSTPLVTKSFIVFGTADHGLVALKRETLDYAWSTPVSSSLTLSAPYTKRPVSSIETSPVLSGNTIFYGASDGTLYGVNESNGAVVWSHKTAAPVMCSVAVSGNTLFAADFAGNVYAFSGSN